MHGNSNIKKRKVIERCITMVWAGDGTAPPPARGGLPKPSCAIHIHDITAQWNGMTRQTVHCTNSACRTRSTVPVQHGYYSFPGTECQYYGLPASIFTETAQGKTVQYRKRSEPEAHSTFNNWGVALCWYSAYPLFPTAVYSSTLYTETEFSPPKSYQLPHKLHGVIHQKTIIFDSLLKCISEKKGQRGCALDSFASG